MMKQLLDPNIIEDHDSASMHNTIETVANPNRLFAESANQQIDAFIEAHKLLSKIRLLESNVIIKGQKQKTASEASNNIVVKLDGKIITLKKCLARCGSKKVFDIGDDTVIMVQNTNADGADPLLWDRLIEEEISMAAKFNAIGLRSQRLERATLTLNDYPMPVIKAPSFAGMLQHGMQVRDAKRPTYKTKYIFEADTENLETIEDYDDLEYGSSTIFANKLNLQDARHWAKLLEHISDELVIYLAHGFAFGSDTFNILIADTPQTPSYSLIESGVVTDRHQQLHLFFYDFSSKFFVLSDEKTYKFIDNESNVVEDNVREEVDSLWTRMLSIVIGSARNEEGRAIFQKGDLPFGYSIDLTVLAGQVINDEVKPAFVAKVTQGITKLILAMSKEERQARYNVYQPAPQNQMQ